MVAEYCKGSGADPESGKRGGHLAEKKLKSKKKKKRSVYLAGTGLQTLTAIVPALVGCPEHSTLGDAKSSSLALGVG